MGFFDAQRAKNDRLIAAACEGRLESGEEIVTAFPAMRRIPWWPVVFLFPVFFYFEYTGTDLPPGSIGLTIGALFLVMLRSFFVVLTDRRLLVLHLRWMSTKNIASEKSIPLAETTAQYHEGLLGGRLRLDAGETKYDLQVAKPFRDRAHSAAAALTGSGTSPAGTA